MQLPHENAHAVDDPSVRDSPTSRCLRSRVGSVNSDATIGVGSTSGSLPVRDSGTVVIRDGETDPSRNRCCCFGLGRLLRGGA